MTGSAKKKKRHGVKEWSKDGDRKSEDVQGGVRHVIGGRENRAVKDGVKGPRGPSEASDAPGRGEPA